MDKVKTKNILMWTLITVAILIIFSIKLIVAINTVSTGFKVISLGAIMEIDAWSVCRDVDNNRAVDIFVPTKTSNEWLSFRSNTPSNVALTATCTECTKPSQCTTLYPDCSSLMDCFDGWCCAEPPTLGDCPIECQI